MAILEILVVDDTGKERDQAIYAVLRGLGLEELYLQMGEEEWFDRLVYLDPQPTPPKSSTRPWTIVVCEYGSARPYPRPADVAS